MAHSSSSVEELKEALRDNLDSSGALAKLRAQCRASIYQAINDPIKVRQNIPVWDLPGIRHGRTIRRGVRSQRSVLRHAR